MEVYINCTVTWGLSGPGKADLEQSPAAGLVLHMPAWVSAGWLMVCHVALLCVLLYEFISGRLWENMPVLPKPLCASALSLPAQ